MYRYWIIINQLSTSLLGVKDEPNDQIVACMVDEDGRKAKARWGGEPTGHKDGGWWLWCYGAYTLERHLTARLVGNEVQLTMEFRDASPGQFWVPSKPLHGDSISDVSFTCVQQFWGQPVRLSVIADAPPSPPYRPTVAIAKPDLLAQRWTMEVKSST